LTVRMPAKCWHQHRQQLSAAIASSTVVVWRTGNAGASPSSTPRRGDRPMSSSDAMHHRRSREAGSKTKVGEDSRIESGACSSTRPSASLRGEGSRILDSSLATERRGTERACAWWCIIASVATWHRTEMKAGVRQGSKAGTSRTWATRRWVRVSTWRGCVFANYDGKRNTDRRGDGAFLGSNSTWCAVKIGAGAVVVRSV